MIVATYGRSGFGKGSCVNQMSDCERLLARLKRLDDGLMFERSDLGARGEPTCVFHGRGDEFVEIAVGTSTKKRFGR